MLISCTESGLASFSCLWQRLGLGSGYQRRRHEYLDRRELVLGRELPVRDPRRQPPGGRLALAGSGGCGPAGRFPPPRQGVPVLGEAVFPSKLHEPESRIDKWQQK